MAQTIDTNGITVVNETDKRGLQIRDLISQYIPGLGPGHYGFRTVGSSGEALSFPCFQVEPIGQDPKMITTGKYHKKWQFEIWVFVVDNSPQDIVTLLTDAVESLLKLFSNNALNDIGSGNTNKFKANSGYWLDSEMKFKHSWSFVSGVPSGSARYMRAALMQFEIEDVLIA